VLECPARTRDGLGARKCLIALGTNACYVDDYPDSVAFLEEAVSVTDSCGDRLGLVEAYSWLGFVRLLLDDLRGACDAFERSHATATERGNPQFLAYALSKLGILADAE